jgi:hypothetical protein
MEKVTIYSDIKLGSYSPEDGDLSEGFITDCDYVGMLTDEEGKPNTLIYRGEGYVCILTLNSGYGKSAITIHDESVLEEIKNRLK